MRNKKILWITKRWDSVLSLALGDLQKDSFPGNQSEFPLRKWVASDDGLIDVLK
jgi:hypothetical protein